MEYYIVRILFLLIIFMAGFILGFLIFSIKPTGELIIDTSDPETEKWLVVLDEPNMRARKKHVAVLRVSNRPIKKEIYDGQT